MSKRYNAGMKEYDEINLMKKFDEFMRGIKYKDYTNRYAFSDTGDNDYLIYKKGENWILDYKYDEHKRIYTNLLNLLNYLFWELGINYLFFYDNSDVRVPIGTDVIIVDDDYVDKCINSGEEPILKKGVIVDSIFDSYEKELVYEIAIDDELVLASHEEGFQKLIFKTIEEFIRDTSYEISTIEAAILMNGYTNPINEERLKILKEVLRKTYEYRNECLDRNNDTKEK